MGIRNLEEKPLRRCHADFDQLRKVDLHNQPARFRLIQAASNVPPCLSFPIDLPALENLDRKSCDVAINELRTILA